MLKSMTAFARDKSDLSAGTLTWELRSVNHRYLEPSFRLPDAFREIEPRLREALRKRIARGKIDCSLKWQANAAGESGIELNQTTIANLKQATDELSAQFTSAAPVDLLAVLSWPGVINQETADQKSILNASLKSFENALSTLTEHRKREGEQLKPLLTDRLDAIENIVATVREQLPAILTLQSDNIRQRFEDAQVELDNQRLEQEMVLLAQKSDVAEELDRLDAHVHEVRATLNKKEPVGRRLDFLMQELNREANTLSSKAIVTDTTKAAIELKVLIEQMREQVQNIE